MEFVRRWGAERLCREELEKLRYLHSRLARMEHVELYTPAPEAPWFVPVLSFNVRGQSSEAVGERLAKAGIAVRCGLHCALLAHEKFGTLETGTVRVPLRRLPEGRIWTPWLSKWPAWAGRRPTGPTGLGDNFGESEKRLLFAVFLC